MNWNLPNYFLADLPPEMQLGAREVREACLNLKRNRERFLLPRTTSSLIRILSELAEEWMRPDFSFRMLALERGPLETGFSVETLRLGLDGFFSQLTEEHLQALIMQDLGSPTRLDGFSQTGVEGQDRRSSLAMGPELLVHIAAGNLPNPALMHLVLGLITRSAQFMKCATHQTCIPRLFAHSLYEMEPKIASCIELAYWPGGHQELEAALFAEADVVTATGRDETLAQIKSVLPPKTRFLGYGHRVSFGYVSSEVLTSIGAKKIVQRAAADVMAWDQQGCLSPHAIYVESRGAVTPQLFAEMLSEELARLETQFPRAALSVEESASIASKRSFYEVRAAHSMETRLWCSPQSTAWTVVYENDPLFQLSCLNRFVFVKAATDLEEVLRQAESVRGSVSTVGLAVGGEQFSAIATRLARWGVRRICPLGKMQQPPFAWRHDGRPSLGDLVDWTDLEQ